MDEKGWMIEIQGKPVWWTGRNWLFSADPNDGIRFARREDGERILRNLVLDGLREPCVVTEHLWPAPVTEGPK
jgi:hypothetical protein